jgi:hypothetical protein
MRTKMKTIIALIAVFSVTGCASLNARNFDYQRDGSRDLAYNGKDVSILLSEMDRTSVQVQITNKSSGTIRLITDESAFTDTNGKSRRVITGDTVVLNRSSAQPPVVVPKGATVSVSLVPADAIDTAGGAGGVFVGDIMPGFGMDKSDQKGKKFSLLMTFRRADDSRFEETVAYVITGPKKSQ